MSTRNAVGIILILAAILASGLSPLLRLPAAAQSCQDATTTGFELKWDDGVAWDTVSRRTVACTSCMIYQGVQFTLPEGMSTTTLTKARVYAGPGKDIVKVHVTGADRHRLIDAVELAVDDAKWYEIALPDVTVSTGFCIFVECHKFSNNAATGVEPFFDDDGWSGHSLYGETIAAAYPHTLGDALGDFMIRAVITPTAQVGIGQDYETIQEAVDSVWDGWTILVHEGTYNENVTVDKSVIIKSISGPSKTVVQTSPPYSDNNVFRITASCVTLSGFTIESATFNGRAGVYIDDASDCLISGNVIQDNNYGIYVSEASTNNILLENECEYDTTGIYLDGSQNWVSGNTLHGNTALLGSAVFLSSVAFANRLVFNSVTVDPGTDPAVAAAPQVYNNNSAEQVNATENWWGTDTGPSNAGGQGPVVGEGIQFDPWLTKQPLRVRTSPVAAGAYTMNAIEEMDAIMLKDGSGTPVVSVASFAENPFRKFPGKPMRWLDVLLGSTVGVDQVEIRLYYTMEELAASDVKAGSLRFFWWNGERWKKCSKTSVNKQDGFVYARLNLKTKPSSSDLGGTMFAVGKPKTGSAWWLIPLILVIVIIVLILFRILWVLRTRREGGYTSID